MAYVWMIDFLAKIRFGQIINRQDAFARRVREVLLTLTACAGDMTLSPTLKTTELPYTSSLGILTLTKHMRIVASPRNPPKHSKSRSIRARVYSLLLWWFGMTMMAEEHTIDQRLRDAEPTYRLASRHLSNVQRPPEVNAFRERPRE